MGARKKKAPELAPEADARATLDGAALLAAARPVLQSLEESLLARATSSPAVTEELAARHAAEREARRTADPFEVWRRAFVEQVAAGWFLSCVFARALEDRGLLERARIAGPGALDSQKSFFELAPSLTERDYLITVFRELASFPAVRELFDARHNPVWLLAPSAEACRELLQLFRAPSAEAPAFRFGASDTRFLGDLYQDLNENVRARYALLQTPRFVERFILDRTLEPAIQRFGLDDTTLIDPTCGSGHFLLGAFDRLFDHRLRKEPGLDTRVAAKKALDAVYGADINPYAVAIARFRLTLAFLEKTGFKKLKQAPELHTNLAVADSLLYNPGKPTFARLAGQRAKAWFAESHALEDDDAARAVLGRQHAAVVGNPPYITVKDAALRELYREGYQRSAFREFSLAAPFTECFFELARKQGRVGMIIANSFMKREFGKRLITEYLPTVNLDLVVNTSGAYIPGHGTPTVLLFGSAEEEQGTQLDVVLASRGEPSTPQDPEKGAVWSSIAEHWDETGFENEFITVARFPRSSLHRHPWSLGGGGATELKELLEERAERRLGDLVDSIGFMCITKQDDVFSNPVGVFGRLGAEQSFIRPFAIGEHIRDWSLQSDLHVLFPYGARAALQTIDARNAPGAYRVLWPYRATLNARAVFGGKTFRQAGREWYEYGQIPADRTDGVAIAFAFVATHNHFVLDRGGKVFKQSAPIIKLPETATEDDHLALLAYLNSSTACFWMKQMMMNKGATSNKGVLQADPEKFRFEFDATKLARLPVPAQLSSWRNGVLVAFARRLTEGGARLAKSDFDVVIEAAPSERVLGALKSYLRERDGLRRRMVAWQEEIDWLCYELMGLLPPDHPAVSSGKPDAVPDLDLHDRPFLNADDASARRVCCSKDAHISILESSEYKRRWFRAAGAFDADNVTDDMLVERAASDVVARKVEHLFPAGATRERPQIARESIALPPCAAASKVLAREIGAVVGATLADSSVPFLAAHRYSDPGLEKRAAWERTWDLQRREDAGENVGEIPVPPKYDQKDFRDANYFRLRGKLDVPKERFISYPGCESDEDGEPVYGWAGWNHLERAQALATLYQDRKTREGWRKERLLPMLAGLLELVPWIKQWHNEPSAEFDGLRLGDYFETFLRGECTEHGFTEQDLREWKPEAKTRASRKRAVKAKAMEEQES